MLQSEFTILRNAPLTRDVYRMELSGDISAITCPGQFVEIKLPGFFLRRPISVCNVRIAHETDGGMLTLVYKVVGQGTDEMSHLQTGQCLNLLSGLGHGFSVPAGKQRVLLVGGGVGVPPLLMLADRWLAHGVVPTVVLGFNKKDEIILADDFRNSGAEVIIATADGSEGVKGFVTDGIAGLGIFDFYQACGPLPMLKALTDALPDTEGEVSLEERMGCGFGACMGCSIHTTQGPRRVCKDGPVFKSNEITWNL